MARNARLVIPGHPHHVIQRGARNMKTFFKPGDYKAYLTLLGEWSAKAGTAVWAYCLMPNHIHLILNPAHEDGLRAALGETHRRYSRLINDREGWRGHLWQERFHSFPMDEAHLLACARYVELNPIRARLAKKPQNWKWSSAAAHLDGADDGVAVVKPLLDLVPDWSDYLSAGIDAPDLDQIRAHVRSSHPLGKSAYYKKLEKMLGRDVKPRPRGRPKATATTK